MKILITGANGFVGKYLCDYFEPLKYKIVRGVRNSRNFNEVSYGDMKSWGDFKNWKKILYGVDTIIHCAARVHIMNGISQNALSEFRLSNVIATKILADKAIEFGVKKFIFLSTIKVNGEETDIDKSFTETDSPRPLDFYGRSKYEAEEVLRKIYLASMLEVTIIRPPLMYGPRVKGNFSRLMTLIENMPILPLGKIQNKRSFLSLKNLSGLILKILESRELEGFNLFLASDSIDLSTSEVVRLIGNLQRKKTYLIPSPVKFLNFCFKIVKKEKKLQKIFGNLTIDSSYAQERLQWIPEKDISSLFKEIKDE